MTLLWLPLQGRNAHALGRELLEQAVGGKLPEIALTQRGKPYFADDSRHFSISHTPRHVFVAVSDRNIGIDAEESDRPVRPAAVKRLLSPEEWQRCQAESDPNAAFLRLWVQKEAAAKLSGQGLTHDVNKTNFRPDSPTVHLIDGCFVAILEE